MDLSNIQPTFRKFNNEMEAEKFLAKLSFEGGKKVDVINIYAKGSSLYVWFYYDRAKLGFKTVKADGLEKAEKVAKKVTKKRRSKKKVN